MVNPAGYALLQQRPGTNDAVPLCVDTILLQVHKWTTNVTLEHKTVELVKCNTTS